MHTKINPGDPLLKTGPARQLDLFDKFSDAANGYSAEDAINAGASIVINALRQVHQDREKALQRFDEIFGRAKQILSDQYTSAGRLKGVYPYDQTVLMPMFDARKN